MRKKAFFLCVFFVFITINYALNVVVDDNRFLDNNGNTRLEMVYQVPYNHLVFERSEYGFEADLDVTISLERDGEIVYEKNFTNKIITHQADKTASNTLYKDKIVLTLSKSVFITKLLFEDPRQEEISEWSKPFEILDRNEIISEIELNKRVVRDTTSYLANLHRNGMLFDVAVDHVVSKKQDGFVLYYELQNIMVNEDNESNLIETITITKDSEVVFTKSSELINKGTNILRLKNIDTKDFSEGMYYITLKIEDKLNSKTAERKDWFVVKEIDSGKYRIFTSLEAEFKLIRYFTSTNSKVWKQLDDFGKAKFIDKFWFTNDPTPGTEKNEFFEIVKERVKIANQRYKTFSEGWETDMGRIYIRHGQPDEIIKENTGINTKYAEKDYEIWKYRLNEQLTYVFIDFQNSKKYKIIYSDNDPKESSLPDWEMFLGEEFDKGILE